MWSKVCGHRAITQTHMLLECPFHEAWALIWSWSSICCYKSLHKLEEGFLLHFRACFLHHCIKALVRFGTHVGQEGARTRCSFRFIPKAFNRVEVRAICRPLPLQRLHFNLSKVCNHGARFVHRGLVMLEQV